MLNWSIIDNEKTFQRLTNHLFALECDSPGFIPSSPYIGSDNGWDGYFNGYYPLEAKKGLFSIQSKWTKKSFDEACTDLRSVVKTELSKAQKNGVNHLRILTNAEMRVEHILDLKSLNQDEVETLEIWHRENLDMRIVRQAYLRFLFFKDYQYPALVDTGFYYANIEHHILPSTIERPALAECKHKFEHFIRSKDLKIYLLSALGGQGKSHFLRDIFPIAHNVDSQRQVWFVRPSFINKSTIQTEIISGKKYLLIVDDADRYVEELRSLLNFLRESGEDVKIIFSTRSSGVYILTQVIQEMKCFEFMDESRLAEWNRDELTELLRSVVGKTPVKDEEQIVHYYPNPYLAVWIGNAMKGTMVSDFSVLKRKFVGDVISDTRECLNGLIDVDFEIFIFTLSCIVPFYIENKDIIEKLALYFNVRVDLICSAIERLIKAGILRQVGRSIRFNPDMRGDIYLSYKLESIEEQFLKPFILHWITIVPNNIFSNIGSASKYGEINKVKTCLSEIIFKWESSASVTPFSERREYLKFIEDVAVLVPEESMSLLCVYQTVIAPEEHNPYLVSFRREFTTDDYGPVVLELMRVAQIRRDVLNFIVLMENSVKNGTYGNYHIETLISKFVCPLSNNIENIVLGLDLMEPWISEENPKKLKLLEVALQEVLAGTHEFTRSFMDKFEFGERYLLKHPKVLAMRDKAMGILNAMLDSQSLEIRLHALNVVRDIGKMVRGGIAPRDLPLNDKIVEETQLSVERVGSLINESTDFRLLSEIEDMFIHFWATKRPGTDNVVIYLKKIPRSPEYLIYRSFVADEFVIEDFAEIERDAPRDDRWTWFVHNVRLSRWDRKEEDYVHIVEQLNLKYTTPEDITLYLNNLGGFIAGVQSWGAVISLNIWVKLSLSSFTSIRENPSFWDSIPEIFRNQIDCALVDMDESHLNRLAEEIFSRLPNVSSTQISTFLWLIEKYTSKVQWYDWLKRLIQSAPKNLYSNIIHMLYFIVERSGEVDKCIDLVVSVIDKIDEITKELVNALDFFVRGLKEDIKIDGAKSGLLKYRIIEILSKIPRVDWHEQDLLNICITNIDDLLVFIDGRLDLQNQMRDVSKFDAIPFEGIGALQKVIVSYDDYVKFIEKVIEWNKKEKCEHVFDLSSLVKPAVRIKDQSTGETYHTTYIRQLLGQKDVEKSIFCLEFLPLNDSTCDIFIGVANVSIEFGFQEEIKNLFFRKTLPGDGWSGPIGQVPRVFVNLKESFVKMYDKAKSGIIESIIKKCIVSIESSIKEHLDRDAEHMSK